MPSKKSVKKTAKTSTKAKNQGELIQKLLESNLESQKKQIELMLEFKNLSLKVDSLVNLFTDATKLIKKGEEPLSKKVDKLVSLFDKAAQNIEKGEYRDPLMNEIKKLTKQ